MVPEKCAAVFRKGHAQNKEFHPFMLNGTLRLPFELRGHAHGFFRCFR